MKNTSSLAVRNATRWLHLAGAAWLGTFVYSPWSDVASFRDVTRFAVIPLLVLTGLLLWKQAQVRKLFRAFTAPSTNAPR